jgi:signal transduction histidine kinase
VEIKFFEENRLKSFIHTDFIMFLQGILFNYLKRSSTILMGETEIMKREMEALRSYIGAKKKREYNFKKHDIGEILEENVDRFKPVLLEENIEIEYKSSGNLEAEISKNDIDRVICNLFVNAKKYSYKGKRRFVKVKAREMQPGNHVEISIQSFGVPIKKEEIENRKIWGFGYRGEMAYAYDRDGIGAGLTDAKDVVEAHQGEITITSEPAAKLKENGNPGYNIPYLTTVIINLPKTMKREEKGETNGN